MKTLKKLSEYIQNKTDKDLPAQRKSLKSV